MQCRHCGAPIRPGDAICPACGTRQPQMPDEIRCRACGQKVAAVLTVCPHCGRSVRPAVLPPLRSVLLVLVLAAAVVFAGARWTATITGDMLLALLPDVSHATLVPPAVAAQSSSGPGRLFGGDATTAVVASVSGTAPALPLATLAPAPASGVAMLLVTAAPSPTVGAQASPTDEPAGQAVATATRTAGPATTVTAIPEPSATATHEPTATPVPPTATPAPTATPTVTPVPTATPTVTPLPTATPAVRRPTATPVPPTATDTPEPPAATPTSAVILPAPELVAPDSGTPYHGEAPLIMLRWLRIAGMTSSMAYRLDIGYAIDGQFAWRARQVIDGTEWVLPSFFGRLADRQGGRRFSWRVTIVTFTRSDDGQLIAGQAVSPTSDTWEFIWND